MELNERKSGNQEFKSVNDFFTKIIGNEIPWQKPNISKDNEEKDLLAIIQNGKKTHMTCCDSLGVFGCCLTGLGIIYDCRNVLLIHEGTYGLSMNAGKPELLTPGWHFLASPWNSLDNVYSTSTPLVKVGPVTIIRIPQGSIGFAMNNTEPEVLLPGTHCRNEGTFRFTNYYSLENRLITFGQIKFLIVKTGFVQVCYLQGVANVLYEGRYAINTPLLVIGDEINTQQQNIPLNKQSVLLDGGINMVVEGLLTYQIVDANKLIKEMGNEKLVSSITDITKAELARVFATIHLEMISSVAYNEAYKNNEVEMPDLLSGEKIDRAIAGKEEKETKDIGIKEEPRNIQRETRVKICEQVKSVVGKLAEKWGVKIINFQLESTKLADAKYGQEYEAASLAIAKAKAQLQANAAENKVLIQKSKAFAEALRIESEGKKTSVIIQAQGTAEAMKIEGKGRSEAADYLTNNKFGQEMALTEQKVNFARELKATTLIVSGNDAVSGNVLPMLQLNQNG
jgi:regulator of protease activity HflC (stomatin/prohibitin superfamily)